MNRDEIIATCNFFDYAKNKVADSLLFTDEELKLDNLMYDYRNELENDLETEDEIEIDVDKMYDYLKELL